MIEPETTTPELAEGNYDDVRAAAEKRDPELRDPNSLERLKQVLKPESPEELGALRDLYKRLMPPKDTCVAYCSGAQMHAKFVESLIAVLQASPRIGWASQVITGPAMSLARRDQIAGFLNETEAAYVLMVDTDIVFTIDDVNRLLELADAKVPFDARGERPAVYTGLYCDAIGRPVAGMWDKDRTSYRPLAKPPTEPTKISAAGAGFLLIPRIVFDHIGPEYAFNEMASDEGRKVMGEDVSFCRRLADAKIDLILHPDVRLGHCKENIVYPDGTKIPV